MNCPTCNKKLGALTAVPHCTIKQCTWTRCNCGTTVDRNTSRSFGGPA